jgi:hypothetical protein
MNPSSVVLQVLGQVDRGRAALAQLALDPVAVGKGRSQAVGAAAHDVTCRMIRALIARLPQAARGRAASA